MKSVIAHKTRMAPAVDRIQMQKGMKEGRSGFCSWILSAQWLLDSAAFADVTSKRS